VLSRVERQPIGLPSTGGAPAADGNLEFVLILLTGIISAAAGGVTLATIVVRSDSDRGR
jgi:hypothetical protein